MKSAVQDFFDVKSQDPIYNYWWTGGMRLEDSDYFTWSKQVAEVDDVWSACDTTKGCHDHDPVSSTQSLIV